MFLAGGGRAVVKFRAARPGAEWAAWHLPGGPVGPPARWAAASNVKGGSETGPSGPYLGSECSTRINYLHGTPSS